jgi:hypothetical protein
MCADRPDAASQVPVPERQRGACELINPMLSRRKLHLQNNQFTSLAGATFAAEIE